ncbi:FIG01121145: hypothetical protein, partial [hydrothermal vent metagenome]
YQSAAARAFSFLHTIQQPDGSLPGQCGASAPLDKANRKLLADKATPLTDTNFAAFPILGIYHNYVLHGDRDWLQAQLSFVDAARNFVLSHQSPHGDIAWRRKQKDEQLEQVDALRTGNCSIYKSLLAGEKIDKVFGNVSPQDARAIEAIRAALLEKPFRFDRTWESKARFAMDWYYPVLTGVVTGPAAKTLIAQRYREFVEPDLGCRCVSDEPWTTTAETCELVLALLAIGEREKAQNLLQGLAPLRADDGGYWMGWQSVENLYWPQERPSWTAAAVILALDAVHQITPAHGLLVGQFAPLQSRCSTTSEPV